MKLIKPSCGIKTQKNDIQGIYEHIEWVGRHCYKSHDKTTPDSAESFVNRMIKSGHGAMLEHGTVYLYLDSKCPITGHKYRDNKYSKYTEIRFPKEPNVHKYITTNYRVIIENGWESDLQYLCEPTEYHEKRITAEFHTDRITGESFLRHRAIDEDHPELHFCVTKEMESDINSFARQSTRYCNYGKDKFENQLTYVIPTHINIGEGIYLWEDSNPYLTAGGDVEKYGYDDSSDLWMMDSEGVYCEYKRHYEDWKAVEVYMHSLQMSENDYLSLIKLGWKPEQARYVLNFSIYSPLVMTAFESDWEHFFKLRCDKSAHPDAQYLANKLKDLIQ